jgi:hypothetical protein
MSVSAPEDARSGAIEMGNDWDRVTDPRSPDWLKFKNPEAPAVKSEAEEDWENQSSVDGLQRPFLPNGF